MRIIYLENDDVIAKECDKVRASNSSSNKVLISFVTRGEKETDGLKETLELNMSLVDVVPLLKQGVINLIDYQNVDSNTSSTPESASDAKLTAGIAQRTAIWYNELSDAKKNYLRNSYSAFYNTCTWCKVDNATICQYFLSSWRQDEIDQIVADVDNYSKSLPGDVLQ